MTHYFFAFLLVLFKFVLKMSTARNMSRVDLLRALLSFPLDLAFLGLSFGVIYILNMQNHSPAASTEAVLAVFLGYVVFACAVALVCRRSDSLFYKDEDGKTVAWTGVNYFLAFGVLALSVYIQK